VTLTSDSNISILKALWTRQADGRWGVYGAKSLKLAPRAGHEPDYFALESDIELLTPSPPKTSVIFSPLLARQIFAEAKHFTSHSRGARRADYLLHWHSVHR
jgi:hypothetical protein